MDLGTLMTTFGADLDPLQRAVGLAQVEFEKYKKAGGSAFDDVNTSAKTSEIGINNVTTAVKGLAAAFAIYKIADMAKDIAMAATRYETLGVVLDQVGKTAGYTSGQMDAFAVALQKTGISMTEARLNITKMVQAHLELSKSTELARIAQDAAVIGNMNSSDAFARMIYGIQSGQTEVLRTIGINVSFEESYKKLADQLGKTSNELSQTEKATARMNAVLESGPAIAGVYEAAMDTAGKQLNSMTRYAQDAKVMLGEVFTPALSVIVKQVNDQWKEFNEDLKNSKTAVREWGKTILEVVQLVVQGFGFLGKAVATYKTIFGETLKFSAEMQGEGVLTQIKAAEKRLQDFQNPNSFRSAFMPEDARLARVEKEASLITSLKKQYEELNNAQANGNLYAKEGRELYNQLDIGVINLIKKLEFQGSVTKNSMDVSKKALQDLGIETKNLDQGLNDYKKLRIEAFEKSEAVKFLANTTNEIIRQNASVEELTKSLMKQKEYDAIKKVSGEDAANDWVKESIKKAAQEANEYQKAVDAAQKAAERLADKWTEISAKLQTKIDSEGLSDLQIKLLNITAEAEKYKRELTDLPPTVKAVAFAAIEAAEAEEKHRAVMVAETKSMKEKEAQDLKEIKATDQAIKAYNRLEKQYGLTLDITDELTAGSKILIEYMLAIGKTAEEAAPKIKLLEDILEGRNAETQAAFYKDLEGYEQKYYSKKLESIEAQRKANAKLCGEEAAQAKARQQLGQLDYEIAKKKIDSVNEGIGSMQSAFTSIQSMYKEGSAEYEKWGQAAKAMIVAQKALAVVQAVIAIATQGTGDPYTAFARIAAMASAMASLLGSIGTSVNSSSSTSSIPSVNTGANGAPLGTEVGSGSNSIANSYKLLQDTYSMEDTKLTRIYNELRDLNHNITSLVTSIVRTGGITGSGFSETSNIGAIQSTYNSLASYAFGGALVGDDIANILTLGISSLFSSALGAVFGGDSKTTLQWTGIEIGATLVSAILAGGQIQAQQFASYHTETSGGWFSSGSDTRWTEYSALDQQVVDALTHVYKSMSDTLMTIAKGLGTDVNAVLNYVFAQTQIDLKGQTVEQMNKTLNDYFSSQMDTAVYDLFGTILLQYQKIDEGLMETAIRIIKDRETILYMLDMTHIAFSGTKDEAFALSEKLINLAGDLSTLTDAFSTYYDKFFTETQKQIDLQNELNYTFSQINAGSSVVDPNTGLSTNSLDLVLPATREGFQQLVSSLDLTTESGQAAYVALLELSGAADQYYSGLEAAQKTLDGYNAYYQQTMGTSSALGKTLDDITKQWEAANSAAVVLGKSQEELTQIYNQAVNMQNKVIQDWASSYYKQVSVYLGTSSALGNSLDNINKYFADQIATATTLGATTDQLTAMYAEQSAAQQKAISDWAASEIAYYNNLMGLNSSLGDSLDAITKHYEDAIKSAQEAGLSTDELAQAEANAKAKATADYWQGAVDYYNGLMGYTSALEKQINDINKAFAAYIASATSAEQVAALQLANAQAIERVMEQWALSIVKPFVDIAAAMAGWAQGQVGVSTFDQAQTAYQIKLDWIAISGDDAQTQFENTTKALQDFFSTVIAGLEKTYEALKNMKATLAADIENIQVNVMSPTDQVSFYANRAVEGFKGLSGLLDEDIPAAVDKVRSDVLKYYDLEKKVIQDKYKTEIDLINKKYADEIQNIQAVRDKLLSLTYSAYNLALPHVKAETAQQDYAKLFAAAQTGDSASVSKFLSFTDTYLKSGQDAYKSSQQYLDMYAKVMADIQSLDSNPAKTVAELTDEQNKLIDEQTKAMQSELAALDKTVVDSLKILGDMIDSRITSTAADLATVFNLLMQTIAAGIPVIPQETPGQPIGYSATGALTNDEIKAFYADSNSIFADGMVTTSELMMLGITTQASQMNDLIVATGMSNTYLSTVSKELWDLNHAAGVGGYAEGGIASGPESGYRATLHGTELVVSPKNSVPVRMSGGGGYGDPKITQLLETLVIQGSKKQNVILTIDGKTVTAVMEVVADRLDQNRVDKKITHRNYGRG